MVEIKTTKEIKLNVNIQKEVVHKYTVYKSHKVSKDNSN